MTTALELPDLPRWALAHGIADDPESWRAPLGGGFALGHDPAKLIVIVGDAAPDAVAQLAELRRDHAMLFAIEREDLAVAVRAERAILHALTDPGQLPEIDGAVPLGDAALPAPLAIELTWARRRGPVWSVWVDGEPVSFAYAPWRTTKWFDVSVETLPGARQLGLATVVAAALIHDERSRGREPVWGADESNLASRRLAKRLGFEPVDEIWVCAPS